MQRIVTSYSLMPDTKVKIELLAKGLGKTVSRLIDDLIDDYWKKNADKIRVDRLPSKYQDDVSRLFASIATDTEHKIKPDQLLQAGLSMLPEKKPLRPSIFQGQRAYARRTQNPHGHKVRRSLPDIP
jgi:hypothetical protein